MKQALSTPQACLPVFPSLSSAFPLYFMTELPLLSQAARPWRLWDGAFSFPWSWEPQCRGASRQDLGLWCRWERASTCFLAQEEAGWPSRKPAETLSLRCGVCRGPLGGSPGQLLLLLAWGLLSVLSAWTSRGCLRSSSPVSSGMCGQSGHSYPGPAGASNMHMYGWESSLR